MSTHLCVLISADEADQAKLLIIILDIMCEMSEKSHITKDNQRYRAYLDLYFWLFKNFFTTDLNEVFDKKCRFKRRCNDNGRKDIKYSRYYKSIS